MAYGPPRKRMVLILLVAGVVLALLYVLAGGSAP